MMPAQKLPIVAFAATPWLGPWLNRQQLLSRLAARGWPVVYSGGAMSAWDRDKPEWHHAKWRATRQWHDGVCVDVAGRLPLRWPKVHQLDQWAIRRYVAGLLHRAGHRKADALIAYVFRPQFLPYAEAMLPRYLVYHPVDNYSLTPEWTSEMASLEARIVARANLIVSVSRRILDNLPDTGTAPRMVLPNGADVPAFMAGARAECPADLAAIPTPRIAYVGRINRKVDFALVAAVAQARSDWHWVFIGPVLEGAGAPDADPANRPWFQICRSLANVHFLGMKPVTALPAYMAHMDVNTMCYREAEGWWAQGHPLKLFEYLAAGKPVISVPRDDTLPLSDVVDIASGAPAWIAAIDRALTGRAAGTVDGRQTIAVQNSWDRRVDMLEGWLREMINHQP